MHTKKAINATISYKKLHIKETELKGKNCREGETCVSGEGGEVSFGVLHQAFKFQVPDLQRAFGK